MKSTSVRCLDEVNPGPAATAGPAARTTSARRLGPTPPATRPRRAYASWSSQTLNRQTMACWASKFLHDCLAICQASTVDFIIRRCQGSRNIYHGFLWKSGVAASLPAGMEFVPEFHIHCYSCVPTHHGWCARLCSRLYRPADDRASVFYSPPELSYRNVSIRMYPYTRHRCCHLFPFGI